MILQNYVFFSMSQPSFMNTISAEKTSILHEAIHKQLGYFF